MPSPFPGMDPYIEANGLWATFHHAFLTSCHDVLNECLPPNYVAILGERLELLDEKDLGLVSRVAVPDVAVVHDPTVEAGRSAGAPSAATLEPRTVPQDLEWFDEPGQLYVQIVHVPENRVVTDVELLSPSNKRPGSADLATYLARRKALLRHQVNLVELDLLLGGQRLKMLGPLGEGDFFAFVTRWKTAHECSVYGWSVRAPLPTIPLPLRPEDGEVLLPLAESYRRTWQRGRYDQLVRYNVPPPEPLAPTDREWVWQHVSQVQ